MYNVYEKQKKFCPRCLQRFLLFYYFDTNDVDRLINQ